MKQLPTLWNAVLVKLNCPVSKKPKCFKTLSWKKSFSSKVTKKSFFAILSPLKIFFHLNKPYNKRTPASPIKQLVSWNVIHTLLWKENKFLSLQNWWSWQLWLVAFTKDLAEDNEYSPWMPFWGIINHIYAKLVRKDRTFFAPNSRENYNFLLKHLFCAWLK